MSVNDPVESPNDDLDDTLRRLKSILETDEFNRIIENPLYKSYLNAHGTTTTKYLVNNLKSQAASANRTLKNR